MKTIEVEVLIKIVKDAFRKGYDAGCADEHSTDGLRGPDLDVEEVHGIIREAGFRG